MNDWNVWNSLPTDDNTVDLEVIVCLYRDEKRSWSIVSLNSLNIVSETIIYGNWKSYEIYN